jgi:hypothetical protein
MEGIMKLMFNVAALAGAACMFASLAANAERPAGLTAIQNHYYSDASLTVHVGELDYDCRSVKTQWGTQTMYQTWTEVPCGGNGGIYNPGDPPPWYQCRIAYSPYPEAICE